MSCVRSLCLLALTSCIALACGGQVVLAGGDGGGADSGGGSGGSSGGSGGSSGGSSGSSSGADAMVGPDVGVGPVTCKGSPSTIGGSSGGCNVAAAESCTDGSYYAVSCSCPAATCQCSEQFSGGNGGGGGSSGSFSYSGCTSMCADLSLAYEACGFPVPQ